jgi:hypothetical protein
MKHLSVTTWHPVKLFNMNSIKTEDSLPKTEAQQALMNTVTKILRAVLGKK